VEKKGSSIQFNASLKTEEQQPTGLIERGGRSKRANCRNSFLSLWETRRVLQDIHCENRSPPITARKKEKAPTPEKKNKRKV